MISNLRRLSYILVIILIAVISLNLHLRAVLLLPEDFDENIYLAAGQRYATAIRQDDLEAIIDYRFNFEHPALTKLIYGLVILPLPQTPLLREEVSTQNPQLELPQPHFLIARLSAAVFGTLEVLFLAILNPLAGFILAISTWQIKYTSQIMLEPLPAFTSLLLVLCYIQAKQKNGKKRVIWLGLSAFWLGVSAAGKYTYAIAGLAVLADWLTESLTSTETRKHPDFRSRLRFFIADLSEMLAWGMGAVIVFIAFNPSMWHDPIGRLVESLIYHQQYSQTDHVTSTGFPPWQQIIWLLEPVPWHPGVFRIMVDPLLTVLSGLGFIRLWRRQRVMALWLGLAALMLLAWPTKWPQYLLNLLAPYSLSAAEGFNALVARPVKSLLNAIGYNGQPRTERGDHGT